MDFTHVLHLFQGLATLRASDTPIVAARLGLILLGVLLIYLGKQEVLEPLLMVPMGFGMAAVNAGCSSSPMGSRVPSASTPS